MMKSLENYSAVELRQQVSKGKLIYGIRLQNDTEKARVAITIWLTKLLTTNSQH
jgi:hypothetical protein